MHKILLGGLMCVGLLPSSALAGRIVVFADEWQTSVVAAQAGNAGAANVTRLIQNIGGYFGGGSLLVFSDNFGLTDPTFAAAMSGAGYTTTFDTNPASFTLGNLNNYSAVFLAGAQAGYNAATLAQYVNGGGDVYIAAGTADGPFGGAENAYWNPFLNLFGLNLGPDYNGIAGTFAVSSSHPVLAGVTALYNNNGNTVSLFGAVPGSSVIYTVPGGNQGLIGVYDGAVPEPGTWVLLSSGLVCLFLGRRSR
jgi:hypothetical protein